MRILFNKQNNEIFKFKKKFLLKDLMQRKKKSFSFYIDNILIKTSSI